MNKTTNAKTPTIKQTPILNEPLISILHNIQSKIDAAAGAATALELRLRIIAQLEPRVQDLLKTRTPRLNHLIDAVLKVFHHTLNSRDQDIIKKCRLPRNMLIHASFVEFMINITGEALGREFDPRTLKSKPLAEDDLVEGVKCIEKSRALDEFSKRAGEAVRILEENVLRSLKQ
jgi:hypothetical protein